MDDNKKDYKEKQEKIARFAKALGHPARIAILDFLAKRDTCYFGDINEELPIAKATVSQHLKELKDAGLIQGEIETPKVKYCINQENWALAKQLFNKFFCDCQKDKKDTCC
jgi:ArsR family transcriptional regulator, arsenate/arsenite/antimonite-responsive transcriptional repressor